MDTQELFEYNKIHRYVSLEKNGWIDASFEYNFNSEGFRGEKFSSDPGVMFLGCSYTVGIGLPFVDVWTTHVAKLLGLPQLNLGIGGASNDTAFRLANHYIPKLRPKIVIFLESNKYRLEILEYKNQFYNLLPEFVHSKYNSFYKSWISEEQNSQLNMLKNRFAIGYICNNYNIKFLHFNIDQFKGLDLARDLGHLGPKSNKLFADFVIDSIN
jgi:hypothetical protein